MRKKSQISIHNVFFKTQRANWTQINHIWKIMREINEIENGENNRENQCNQK